MAKWQKCGVVRLSESKKVVLVADWELDSKKWRIIDVEELLDLIAGKHFEIGLLEAKEG